MEVPDARFAGLFFCGGGGWNRLRRFGGLCVDATVHAGVQDRLDTPARSASRSAPPRLLTTRRRGQPLGRLLEAARKGATPGNGGRQTGEKPIGLFTRDWFKLRRRRGCCTGWVRI